MDQGRIRTFIYYEWLLGNDTATAVANICRACKEDVVCQRTVRRWFNLFESGDTSLEDKDHSGRPSTVEDDDVLRCIKEKPEATTRELATTLGCNKSIIHSRLNLLGYHKVLARWIPHRLTDANKQSRVAVCQSLLLRPRRKEFLEDLVTGDESWVLYDNIARRAVWIPRGEEPPTTPKADLHPLKLMLCCWWDAKGMLYFELLPQGRTVTASIYADQLQKLASAIREKRPRRASVHLLHNNARPHVAKETQLTLATLGWETVAHPPYSPDLAPSDYHLFRPLKHHLAGKKFTNYNNLKSDIADFFEAQPPEFWAKGIGDQPNRWVTVVDNYGDYIVD
ncbi:hypothetical protein Q1695_013838 [Nippostrongylus brasiliensis]|nr:hypothetical protein Q1695_013838 [Nippostrongylus brasiliensis]